MSLEFLVTSQSIDEEEVIFHHEATVSLARGKLSFFYEGLDVDEDLSHGGDNGAFVGFAAISQAFDVGSNNRVAPSCGMCGHVEAFANLGPPALDAALTGKFTAVAVEWSNAGHGDEAVAAEFLHFTKVGEKRPGGDVPDSFDRLDNLGAGFESWIGIDQRVDFLLDGSKFLFQDSNHSFDGAMDECLAVL